MLLQAPTITLLMSTADPVAGNPVSLQVVYNLLVHEGIMGCMRVGTGEYLDTLHKQLTQLFMYLEESGKFENNLLAAACLVKAWDEGWEPDFKWLDDPLEGEKKVAWCLKCIYDAQVSTITHYTVVRQGVCEMIKSFSTVVLSAHLHIVSLLMLGQTLIDVTQQSSIIMTPCTLMRCCLLVI